jgi:hypothetical protein
LGIPRKCICRRKLGTPSVPAIYACEVFCPEEWCPTNRRYSTGSDVRDALFKNISINVSNIDHSVRPANAHAVVINQIRGCSWIASST